MPSRNKRFYYPSQTSWPVIGLALGEGAGASFNLGTFMAEQADGITFDFTKTDRFFQEGVGPTLADDATEAIGLAMDERLWGGLSLAALEAAQTELVTNGDFASSSGWTIDSSAWTISGGVASTVGTQYARVLRTVSVTTGRLYRTAYEIAAYTSGSIFSQIVESPNSTDGPVVSGTGNKVCYLLAKSGTPIIAFQGNFGGFTGSIDNASLKEIPGNHGIQSSGTLKPIREAAGAKFDGSDDVLRTEYRAAAGDNFLGVKATIPATLSATQIILGASGSSADRIYLGINASGFAVGGLGNHATGVILGTTDLRNTEAVLFLTCDGTTVRLIVNGVVEYQAAQSGTPTTTIPFRIGCFNNNNSSAFFFGGHVKDVRVGRSFITAARAAQIASQMAV
jgi:hypothetical protein